MSEIYDVFRNRIIDADAEQTKDVIKQIERSRENGDITEQERDNLLEIAKRNLDAKGEDAYGRLDQE